MKLFGIGTYGVMLKITGHLFDLLPDSVNTKASVLPGIDKPTGNVYEDVFITDEKDQRGNATIISEANQSINTNNATELH